MMSETLEKKFAEKSEVSFAELLPEEADRYDVAISFVSLLSMIKEQNIDAEQSEAFGEILVRRKNNVQQ